jgi:hypothetical protein
MVVKANLMEKVLKTGHAEWGAEAFDFKIGPWGLGIGLMMRHTGYGSPKETGAGIWATVEKAQEIAEETVKKLLSPNCEVVWSEISASAVD